MVSHRNISFSRYEGKLAVFQAEDGQELAFPREDTGPALSSGDPFVLQLLPAAEALLDQQELARTLLNQLLDDEA